MLYRSYIFIVLALVLFLSLAFVLNQIFSNDGFASNSKANERQFEARLVDPETAPEEIRSLVMLGYRIMLNTKKEVPQYAGDKINCTNCHFSGGNTLGGENNGISLVGVTKKYPRHVPGNDNYTLQDRINDCFKKSINGKPLPIDGQEMKALVAYMSWISHEFISLPRVVPWLGLKKLRTKHVPDLDNGAKVYAASCAMCHGKDGGGENMQADLSYPPVWGPHSFNEDAGFNQIAKLAPFIYDNMPYGDVGLSAEDSLDVAAYIISKPRPKK